LTHNYISGTDKIYLRLKEEVSQKLMVRSLLEVAIKFYSGIISHASIAPLEPLTSVNNSALLAL
jgi:hypothetical protein